MLEARLLRARGPLLFTSFRGLLSVLWGLTCGQAVAAAQEHGACSPNDSEEASARVVAGTGDGRGVWLHIQPASECGAALLKTARVVVYHVDEADSRSGTTQPWTLTPFELSRIESERLELVRWLSIDDRSSDIYAYYRAAAPVALEGTLAVGVIPIDIGSVRPDEMVLFQAVNFSLSGATYKPGGLASPRTAVLPSRVPSLNCKLHGGLPHHRPPFMDCGRGQVLSSAHPQEIASVPHPPEADLVLALIEERTSTGAPWRPFGTLVSDGPPGWRFNGGWSSMGSVVLGYEYRAWFSEMTNEGTLAVAVGPVAVSVAAGGPGQAVLTGGRFTDGTLPWPSDGRTLVVEEPPN